MTTATGSERGVGREPAEEAGPPAVPLAEVDLTPVSHFQVHVHAAAFALIDHLRRLEPADGLSAVLRRHRFLSGYLDAVVPFLPAGLAWGDGHRWWSTAVADWEADAGDALPLCRLDAAAGLGWRGRLQLTCAGLVEEDSRFGQVFAELGGRAAHRPTLEVLTALGEVVSGGDGPGGDRSTPRHLLDLGLASAEDRGAPRSEWAVRVPAELWDVLAGHRDPGLPPGITHTGPAGLTALDHLVLPAELAVTAERLAATLAGGLDLLVVRGAAGSDRLPLVGAIARAAGRGVLHVDRARTAPGSWEAVGPLAVALDAVPVVEADLAPGETIELGRPRLLAGPIVAVLDAAGGIDRRQHERTVSVEVPPLAGAERIQRWRAALDGHPAADLAAIAGTCRLQGANIDRVARSAVTLARLDGAEAVAAHHVRRAAAELRRQLLDTLATRLEPVGGWDEVVAGELTMTKVAELEARCRHREELAAQLGPAYRTDGGAGVGVRALFTGASGTGKTLAARVLAGRLGMEVHRADLAAVVDKYVGETEKNLHRLLTTAEELDVVLLLDEGDSLLGRRTDVRSANDRFANLETNYLLQRLEGYQGIVVVTTNAAEHIDPAFQRRMDVVVPFQPPSARERADIWRLHLPDGHDVPDGVLTELAARCTMTGGQIRNAVLHAALLALGDGRRIDASHVERAVASEFQKAGASSPYDPSGRQHGVSRARSFQQVIA